MNSEKKHEEKCMTNENDNKSLSRREETVPTKINIGAASSIDISWLSEDERKSILRDYTKGMLDISKKAAELSVDAAALEKTLDDLTDTTKEVSSSGNAVTITHSQDTKVGRTEVIMGNTDQAQSGKLSKTQTGEKDLTPLYIIAGIIAIIAVVALLLK
jgi:hypothetical protein